MEIAPSVRVKVHYAEDLFVLFVPQNTGFKQLMDRIERKVRICCGDNYIVVRQLRAKYWDEDGDCVTVKSEEDVQMAFESKLHGGFDSLSNITLCRPG